MIEKTIHLLKEDGSLFTQDNSALFRLSVILEDFIFERENDPLRTEEVALAKRLDAFILSDKLHYFDK